MARLPKRGEILVSPVEGNFGAQANLRSESGFVINIVANAMNYETGLFILDEYLDELGYDDAPARKRLVELPDA